MGTLRGRPSPSPGNGTPRRAVAIATGLTTGGWAPAGRRRLLQLLALVAWALAASGGCTGSRGTAPDTGPLRTDVLWQLETLAPHSGPPIQVTDPSLYTVRFGPGGSVDARVDCNRCAGPYRVAGASLTIGPLGCTLAACPIPTLGDQFGAALSRVSSYVQTSDGLVLTYDGGTLRFRALQ
jgi:heat shock protein HslJ